MDEVEGAAEAGAEAGAREVEEIQPEIGRGRKRIRISSAQGAMIERWRGVRHRHSIRKSDHLALLGTYDYSIISGWYFQEVGGSMKICGCL